MRLFQSSLNVNKGGTPSVIPDLPIFTKVLDSADYTAGNIYWFKIYLSADFTMLSDLTKTYFAVWSTDHNDFGNSWWGEMNNLDLSDFVEKGKCFSTSISQETPRLYIEGGKCHFFYHDKITGLPVAEPLLLQASNMYQSGTSGESLTDIDLNWTAFPDVSPHHREELGNQIFGRDENHTGYMTVREREIGEPGKKWQCTNLTMGGTYATFRYSEADLLTDPFARETPSPNVQQSIFIDFPNLGDHVGFAKTIDPFYKTGDRIYRFAGLNTENFAGSIPGLGNYGIYLFQDDYKYAQVVHLFTEWYDPSITTIQFDSTYLEPGTNNLHIYQRVNKLDLNHGILDVTNWENWILDYNIPPK